MQRDARLNWPFLTVLLILAVLVVGYVVGRPITSLMAEPEATQTGIRFEPPPLGQQLQIRLFECFLAAWFFFLGASLGSFLNVVVYRTPRGRSPRLPGTSRHRPARLPGLVPPRSRLSTRGRRAGRA